MSKTPDDERMSLEQGKSKYQRFKLTENPFPAEPVVNQDSTDRRINGAIFEFEIRKKEFNKIKKNFLQQPLTSPNHLRLGYIIETSHIGRGTGKSAFLLHLQHNINKMPDQSLSASLSKYFAVIVTPDTGGRTKTFIDFLDCFFQAILRSDIIKKCLAILRLLAIQKLYPEHLVFLQREKEDNLVNNLNSSDWFDQHNFNYNKISRFIFQYNSFQELPPQFPLFQGKNTLIRPFIGQNDFEFYYLNQLKGAREKLDFVFSHLVRFFKVCGYDSAVVLVDDFERIANCQNKRQKNDFAVELRACLLDGNYLNARLGFYNFLLVLHANVPGQVAKAWDESGLGIRAPILPRRTSRHIIFFEQINKNQVALLLKKYLAEYRPGKTGGDNLFPFTTGAVSQIAELADYNTGKVLKLAHDLVEKAADSANQTDIDEAFVVKSKGFGVGTGE